MVCLIVCILIFRSLVFKLVLFVVVVAAALFVFGRLHFDLFQGLTRAFTRPNILYLLYVKFASYIGRVLCKSRLILFRINGPIMTLHYI